MMNHQAFLLKQGVLNMPSAGVILLYFVALLLASWYLIAVVGVGP